MLTTDYVPGAPVWIDLGTPDIEAAVGFYGHVFGWVFESAGPGAGGYGMFKLGGETVAAIGPMSEEDSDPGWSLYFHTSDADATTRAVEQAGGTVELPPMGVFDLGRMAHYTDPAGARFAAWEPAGNGGLDAVGEPGTLCWTELYSTDAATARDFYRAVFGWVLQDAPVGGGLDYALVSPAGDGPDTSQGGIMQLPAENIAAGTTSDWHPYFEVADCDATLAAAAGRGGTVLIPAEHAPGVGRLAMLKDPFGAPFALLTPDTAA
ncbi:VOC family protein [Streptomyces sp. Ru87]|uniref:VOC family protein n=1 Tax=Streptomyces sp. Ru87 TaxID=2044307 RepID=UPI000BF2F4F3|nr:VOC family protein [Streptomyces sp. Ru87]PGH52219.1 hydroxylase [Streptomyces sp. Ru87]